MLSNAYFLAKFRFDTAENEPAENLQTFANFCKLLQTFANFCKKMQNLPMLLILINFANPNPLTRLSEATLLATRGGARGLSRV